MKFYRPTDQGIVMIMVLMLLGWGAGGWMGALVMGAFIAAVYLVGSVILD